MNQLLSYYCLNKLCNFNFTVLHTVNTLQISSVMTTEVRKRSLALQRREGIQRQETRRR